jgi:hypothetical protein
MNSKMLDQIVNAVLYEGYILYPYRPSSKKNRRERFTFGRVYPRDYSESQQGAEPCLKQTECLLQSHGKTSAIEATVRFLQPMWREVGCGSTEASFRIVPELSIGGTLYQSWQEATEREIALSLGPLETTQSRRISFPFSFPEFRALEPLGAGEPAAAGAALLRRQESLTGLVEVEAESLTAGLSKITVRVLNRTSMDSSLCEDKDAVIMRTFASTHTILRATGGNFLSLLDPPAEFKEHAAQCKNIGTWPVLVGDEEHQESGTMLSSPIILYDYPRIAPESNGSFFDGTEIDEMLTLRVLTMTDGEKIEMRQVDECARRILERTEAAGAEDFLKLHGTMREVKTAEEFFNPTTRMENVFTDGRELRTGACVRIRPKKGADAMDMMLAGKTAVVEAIEQDAEGRVHLAVVMDDDPGKDLGLARQPGHRFFYSPEEVELVDEVSA